MAGTLREYRAKVGPPELFDLIGAQQFCVLVKYGLRERHRLFDFGCGCLRAGKFLIPYLNAGNYVGLEPDLELAHYGLNEELGADHALAKVPTIYKWDDFVFAGRMRGDFNYMLAHSIITHAGPDVVKKIFDGAYEVLAPESMFLGTFFQGKDCESVGWLGNDIATYWAKTLESLALDAGFVSFAYHDFGHPLRQLWFTAITGIGGGGQA